MGLSGRIKEEQVHVCVSFIIRLALAIAVSLSLLNLDVPIGT